MKQRTDLEDKIKYLQCIKKVLDFILTEMEYSQRQFEDYANRRDSTDDESSKEYFEDLMNGLEKENHIWQKLHTDILNLG